MSTLNLQTGNTLRTQHSFQISTNYASDPVDYVELNAGFNYTYGTSANQYDIPWSRSNVNLVTAETLTLSSLTVSGSTTASSVARVLEFTILNTGSVAITMTPATSHGWVNGVPTSITLQPGAFYSWAMGDVGVTISSGSADAITLTPASGTGSYKIELKARSV